MRIYQTTEQPSPLLIPFDLLVIPFISHQTPLSHGSGKFYDLYLTRSDSQSLSSRQLHLTIHPLVLSLTEIYCRIISSIIHGSPRSHSRLGMSC